MSLSPINAATDNIKTRPVQVKGITFGGDEFIVIAGPCSIESKSQFLDVATHVKHNGAQMLRGGIFKLRTSPDAFQGLGIEAYELVKAIKNQVDLPFVSEVTDPRQIEEMYDFVDMFQVGSRNMHNYALLKELGRSQKPILLKRGFSGLIKEWLLAAEYITSSGNPNVVLCERGIRTFETALRNTLDLSAIAFVKRRSELPVIADPSHGTGLSELVLPMSLASAAAGADGIIVEVHPNPDQALSDGFQALDFKTFDQLSRQLSILLPTMNRTFKFQ